jgi:lysophospholipase L1-like esterase
LIGSAVVAVGATIIAGAVATKAPYVGFAGLLVCAAGLALIYEAVRHLCESRRVAAVVALVVFAALGGALLVRAFADGSAWLAIFAVGSLVIALLPATALVVHAADAHVRIWILAGLVLVGAGLVATAAHVPAPIAIGGIVVGLLAVEIGAHPYVWQEYAARSARSPEGVTPPEPVPAQPASPYIGVSLAIVTAGALVLALGDVWRIWVFVLTGIVVVALGLIALSASWSLLRPSWRRATLILGVGAFLLVTGRLLSPLTDPRQAAAIAAVLLAFLGAGMAWRGEAFLLLATVGLVIPWTLIDHTVRGDTDPHPSSSRGIIVALGDSYASGEGAEVYFDGTDSIGSKEDAAAKWNQCRRAPTAYPYLVAKDLGYSLDFVACSGATTADVTSNGQMLHSPPGVFGAHRQLDELPADRGAIRAVLITIGGNDVKFGKIGPACALPGSCTGFRDAWLVAVAHAGADVERTYSEIKAELPGVPIVAVPYPLMLTDTGCGWSAMNRAEHAFLAEFVTLLDDRIRRAAELVGINFFRPGLFAFEGTKICDRGPDDSSMNFFNLSAQEGGILDRLNPVNWVHGSFHPNASGHRAIADALEEWLPDLLAHIAGGRDPNPRPKENARFRVPPTLSTVLIDPGSLDAPTTCTNQDVSPFATTQSLIDDQDPFSLHASASSPICYTVRDGTWRTWQPGSPSDDTVRIQPDGTIMIQPTQPDEGDQSIVYRGPGKGGWHVRIVRFCQNQPGCTNDVGAWTHGQLIATARSALPSALYAFFGGFLIALGIADLARQRLTPRVGVASARTRGAIRAVGSTIRPIAPTEGERDG